MRNEGMTMLIVTHELGFAYAVADRVLSLHTGEIFEQGPPGEILVTPKGMPRLPAGPARYADHS